MFLIHFLFLTDCSAKATDEFELARKKVARFINASDSREIVFTRNATEAINLVAYSWGLSNLKPGDEVCAFVSLSKFCFSLLPIENEIVNELFRLSLQWPNTIVALFLGK